MSRTASTISAKLRARRAQREFEMALRNASPSQRQDLLAAARRDSLV